MEKSGKRASRIRIGLGLGLAALGGMALLASGPTSASIQSFPEELITVTRPRADEDLARLTGVAPEVFPLTPPAAAQPAPRPRHVRLPAAVEKDDPLLWERYQIEMKVLGLTHLAFHYQKEAQRFGEEAEGSRGWADHIFLQNVAQEYGRLARQVLRELSNWQKK